MMTTALVIFLGASACMTLSIVAAIALGARRQISIEAVGEEGAATAHQGSNAGRTFVPAFGH
jgi:hypothetical protein